MTATRDRLAKTLYQTVVPGAVASQTAVRNFSIHLGALSATRIADSLIDPKLVLAWLLSALGAPGYLIGMLVPVREAGSLLPQLALAPWMQSRPRRKTFWAVGSLIQGLAALGIATAAVLLPGSTAGWTIILCLALLACARAVCSSSYKDLLARTVEKGCRGTLSGVAGTVGSIAVFGYAVLLATGVLPLEPRFIAATIALAGALWILAALQFMRLDEPDGEISDGGFSFSALTAPLQRDAELRRYLATRAAMISTALAPPYVVMLIGSGEEARLGSLGLLILSSALATILSSYIWGRLSDRSSRRTIAWAGALAAFALGTAGAIGIVTGGLGNLWIGPALLFLAQIGYEGARAGRKTHLTDMDARGQRTLYTALSNSLIGVLLLAGGIFGVLADAAGPEWTLIALSMFAALGCLLALRLAEVQ